jgi:hypothetical protein
MKLTPLCPLLAASAILLGVALPTRAENAPAAAPTPAAVAAVSLQGVMDFHAHSAPDVSKRSATSFEVIRADKAAGMRAVVLKNHYVPTAALAQLAMQEVGGIEVYGGVVLNRSNGGINPEAVRRMVEVEGKRGKVVWCPTFDAENQVKSTKSNQPFVPVVRDGKPVPAMADIFKLCAQNDLVFATGHSSPEESIILLQAAREAGVKRLLVTHVLSESTRANLEQMKRMVAQDGMLEIVYLAHLGAKPLPISVAVEALHTIGAEHFIMSSDLGQPNNPPHAEGLREFIAKLQAGGATDHEIELITRKNPAHLIGLDP